MVTSAAGCSDRHLVANGFSDLIIDVFGQDVGRHARSAFGVAGLLLGFAMVVIAILDVAVAGFLIGANIWFFFILSPSLIATMGREKFVPIQMKLTKLLFRLLGIAAVPLIFLARMNGGSEALLGAMFAAVSALIAQMP